MAKEIRTDCRHFLGDRPCEWGGECEGCGHYSPMGTRILVVKLAAAGDVLRTTSILPPLKRRYPESHVTWVTDAAAVPLLKHNPFVDRTLTFGFDAWLRLSAQAFDVLICLDKDERACALSATLDAEKKLGFAMSRHGAVEPLNEPARYDYELGLSNQEKFFGNQKVYPEIFCETAELSYEGEPYMLVLPDSSIHYAEEFMAGLAPEGPVVGLNVGAGRVFANKAWTPDGLAGLARWIRDELGGTAVVLGGPEDRAAAERVLELAEGSAVDGGTHEVLDFAAIVGMQDAVVTGDTLALHVAVALGVPTVALFGPSAPQEIELYGRGAKVVTPLDCSPCYLRSCEKHPSCMEAIDVDAVSQALKGVMESA